MPDDGTTGKRQIRNPKLEAIDAVENRVTLSQSNLSLWSSPSSGATIDTVDDGLTEEVWPSPMANDYREKISTRVSAVDTLLSTLTQEITSAKNAISTVVSNMSTRIRPRRSGRVPEDDSTEGGLTREQKRRYFQAWIQAQRQAEEAVLSDELIEAATDGSR